MISSKIKYIKKNSVGKKTLKNIIIKGDNKEVIISLTKHLEGKVNCIYIDPPYNNGENYHHYDDRNNHENWLNKITEILKLLKPLLASNGSIWISIDDKEMHYLKIEADKIFGRNNFLSTIIWQQRTTRENRKIFSNNHEYILAYAVNPTEFKKTRNLAPLPKSVLNRYKNPDNDPRGAWQSVSANVQDGHAAKNQFYDIIAPNGKVHSLPNGRCWIYNERKMKQEIEKNNIWFGREGNGVPRVKKFLEEFNKGLTPETLWLADTAGTNKIAKKHLLKMFPNEKIFETPKPEQLIKRVLEIATKEGDLVLDCYLGSGTTISTAHKMNRNYVGIENGSHIVDLVVERMKLVVNGEDGGIGKGEERNIANGFSFYELAK